MSQPLGLKATMYYLSLESDYPSGSDAAFLNNDGAVLHRASSQFVHYAQIEGTAKLSDGRVLTVDGDLPGGQKAWRVSNTPYGLDAVNCGLVPFRSAAVDPAIFALRSILTIQETIGMVLPDGSSHDGTWYAVDTGSAIQGERIDLFTGAGKASMQTIRNHGIDHMQALTVTITGRLNGCTPGSEG